MTVQESFDDRSGLIENRIYPARRLFENLLRTVFNPNTTA